MSDQTAGFMPTREQWVHAERDQRVWHIARALITNLLIYRDHAGAPGFQLEKLDDHLAGLRRLLAGDSSGAAPRLDPCAECDLLRLITIEEWLKRRPFHEAIERKIKTWDQLCACFNEFGVDGQKSCGEYADADDEAMIALKEAWRTLFPAGHDL